MIQWNRFFTANVDGDKKEENTDTAINYQLQKR
ncbi:MAG: hypothetical protein ACJA2U_002829 [Marinomonas primoryensis]|jgi:hypothetical protein